MHACSIQHDTAEVTIDNKVIDQATWEAVQQKMWSHKNPQDQLEEAWRAGRAHSFRLQG